MSQAMKAKRARIGELAAATACLALGLVAFTGTAPARADVLEISPDGAVSVRSGSGAVRWGGESAGQSAGEAAHDMRIAEDFPFPPAALTLAGKSSAPAAYAAALARIAEQNELSPLLLEALVWQESRWRADAVSRAGAIGLAQLMPATARALGVDPRDPLANLAGGARYLRQQLDLFDGDLEKALAAYNAGPGRVLRAGGIPAIAETRAYVAAIVGRLAPNPASPN